MKPLRREALFEMSFMNTISEIRQANRSYNATLKSCLSVSKELERELAAELKTR